MHELAVPILVKITGHGEGIQRKAGDYIESNVDSTFPALGSFHVWGRWFDVAPSDTAFRSSICYIQSLHLLSSRRADSVTQELSSAREIDRVLVLWIEVLTA